MTRYEFYLDGYSGGMRKDRSGKFVLYEDVKHLIEKDKVSHSHNNSENPYDLSNSISRGKRKK